MSSIAADLRNCGCTTDALLQRNARTPYCASPMIRVTDSVNRHLEDRASGEKEPGGQSTNTGVKRPVIDVRVRVLYEIARTVSDGRATAGLN